MIDDRVHCLPGSGSSWLQNSHYVRLRSARGQGPQEDFVEDLKKQTYFNVYLFRGTPVCIQHAYVEVRGKFAEVGSLFSPVGSRDGIQVIRLSRKCHYLVSRLPRQDLSIYQPVFNRGI